MNPLISLSVVSHSDSKKISNLLESLKKCEDTKRFQLILTDNLGGELPDFDPAPWASLHIIRNNYQMGFAKNHNNAFKFVQAEYFAVLNPDLLFDEPLFDLLKNNIKTYQADLIAPQIVDDKGIIQDSFRSLPTPLKLIKRRLLGEDVEEFQVDNHGLIQPDWVAGMFWLMKSDIYRQLGGMDEKFHLYFEDVDLCTRARLQGMKIIVDSKLKIRHAAQRSSRKSLYYLILHFISALRFFTSTVYWQALRNK